MQINSSEVGKDRFLKLLLPDFLSCFSLPTYLACLLEDLACMRTDGRTDRTDALTNRHWPSLPVNENSNILISNN